MALKVTVSQAQHPKTKNERKTMKTIALTILGSILLNPVIGSTSVPPHPEDTAPTVVRQKKASNPEPAVTPARRWRGPDGKLLPFKSDEEIVDFMRNAKVASRERTKLGVNRPYRVLLERDGVKMKAVFRQVSVKQKSLRLDDGSVQLFFRDECRFELAAYRLSRLLGLDNVPPVVERKLFSAKGTLQAWLEESITEKQRREEKRSPESMIYWLRQTHTMDIFDNLISNDDRNLGNMLIDPEWKLWMIDHTRAFRRNRELGSPNKIKFCPRILWERLQKLDKKVLRTEMSGILVQAELQGLLERCDRMLEFLQKLIDHRGEGAVLF